MTEPAQVFDMKPDFAGLIQLLAKNLYSNTHVFVRELIQNAGDSITLRRELEPEHRGRIDIFSYPKQRTLIFRDNGIGLDEQGVKEFLSVIGSTGTGTARDRLAQLGHERARELVGQFGIGMLSAFVVAEKVIVRTRKLGSDLAWAWHNEGSTRCELYADEKPEVGTEVAVIVAEQHTELLDPAVLREAIRRFCDFIRYPIYFNDEGPVNVMRAPWHQRHWGSEEEKERAYTAFLNERFPDFALRVIPVEIDGAVTARGALYITEGKIPDLNSNGRVDLYVRRFLITDGDGDILPPWAKFVGGIIDCPDLQPTAARDNIQRNDPALAALREELARIIIDYLIRLAHDNPPEFARINEWHHYHLKGMALFHDEFFELVGHHLLFDTNRGKMSLDTYLTAAADHADGEPVSLHCFSRRQGRQLFFELADRVGMVVIDAKRTFELELLARYAKAHPTRAVLAPLDVGLTPALFRPVDAADTTLADRLEIGLSRLLRQAGLGNVEIDVRRFAPDLLPSVALATPQTVARQNLQTLVDQDWLLPSLGSLTSEIGKVMDETPPVQIVVNLDNPLVRRLAALDCRRDDLADILVTLILDNPAGGEELVSEPLRAHAAAARQRLLTEALARRAGDETAARAKEA